MLPIGRRQVLTVARATPVGLFLTDGKEDVLLPRKYVKRDSPPGSEVEVFLYLDGEERPVATTERPLAEVGQVASMRCVAAGPGGAFMDWGLEKDLLVPFAEQRGPIRPGDQRVVWVGLDEVSGRLYGSTRLERYLSPAPPELAGQKVQALPYSRHTHGLMCAVEDRYLGMLFDTEASGPLTLGRPFTAYVRKVREDGRVALALTPVGYEATLQEGPALLQKLEKAGGFLPFNDKTSPEEIRNEFGLSKASFKRLIGTLQRGEKIKIESHGIRLVRPEST
ncbi:GntR family transcriptional regulator [bacterium]|nr:MAG: GntR family transcriptional regulator [bacterium]